MSNIQSQLDRVLSAVGKLTSSSKSFQRYQKKLSDTVDKIHNQFKKLNKTAEHLKPIVGYAQETARMRSDLKTYYQSIKQYLFARNNAPQIIQSEAVSQAGSIVYATQNVIQENTSNKKFELNISFGGGGDGGEDDALDLKGIWDALKTIFKGIKLLLRGLGTVFMWLLRTVGKVLLTIGRLFLRVPILALIAAIAIAAIYIWKNWDSLKEKFLTLWENIKTIFSNAWQGIKERVGKAWESIKQFFMGGGLFGVIYRNWDTIKQYASSVWEWISNKIGGVWESIKQKTLGLWESIKSGLSQKWQAMSQYVSTV
ncbi:hypothetical protein ID853_17975, partial [Xenorhabdus sp. Vera]|nr:hypothetical protein [Xenorhabdus sp. Vera]